MFNKKGLLMRDYVIMLVLFSLVAGLGALVVNDMADPVNGYNISGVVDDSFDSAYNQANYTTSLAGELGNATTSKEGLTNVGSTAELLFGSTLTVIQLVAGSFSIVKNGFVNMVSLFGIPILVGNILFGAVLSILIITIAFVIVSSLTKTKV